MITVVLNETLQAVEFLIDEKGVDLLIKRLRQLKADGDHVHVCATNNDCGVSTISPYGHDVVFGEVVLNLLPSDAWEDARRALTP